MIGTVRHQQMYWGGASCSGAGFLLFGPRGIPSQLTMCAKSLPVYRESGTAVGHTSGEGIGGQAGVEGVGGGEGRLT